MLIQPTRRDLIKYGIGAAAFAKMSQAQRSQQVLISQKIASGVAPIALISQIAAGSPDSNNITTGAIATTGATLLIAFVSSANAAISTPTDSKSNTWTALTSSDSTVLRGKVWYVANPTVGSGHTATVTSTVASGYPSVVFAAFSGVIASSPFDQENHGTGAAVTTQQPGSVTPGADNELLILGLSFYDAADTSLSVNQSYTFSNTAGTDMVQYAAGNHIGGAMAYFVQPTAAAKNPTWTSTVSMIEASATAATFKHA